MFFFRASLLKTQHFIYSKSPFALIRHYTPYEFSLSYLKKHGNYELSNSFNLIRALYILKSNTRDLRIKEKIVKDQELHTAFTLFNKLIKSVNIETGCNIINCLGRLRYSNEEFWEYTENEFILRAKEFNEKDLACFIAGYGQTRRAKDHVFQTIEDIVMKWIWEDLTISSNSAAITYSAFLFTDKGSLVLKRYLEQMIIKGIDNITVTSLTHLFFNLRKSENIEIEFLNTILNKYIKFNKFFNADGATDTLIMSINNKSDFKLVNRLEDLVVPIIHELNIYNLGRLVLNYCKMFPDSMQAKTDRRYNFVISIVKVFMPKRLNLYENETLLIKNNFLLMIFWGISNCDMVEYQNEIEDFVKLFPSLEEIQQANIYMFEDIKKYLEEKHKINKLNS